VNLYSTNTQYGTEYKLSAGYLWTNGQGNITTPIGTGKKYYMKIYHPNYGSFPVESNQIFVLIIQIPLPVKPMTLFYHAFKTKSQIEGYTNSNTLMLKKA
jgi:hypothetical protein